MAAADDGAATTPQIRADTARALDKKQMKNTSRVLTDPALSRRGIIRRYLDLPRYLHLLHSHQLFLCRADGFTDRLEGVLTPTIRKAMVDAFNAGKIKESAESFYRKSRLGTYASCWSKGADDNMALWQLYGGVKTSVAITSTVERFVDLACHWQEEVQIEGVRYIDHSKNPDMIIGRYTDPLCFKHKAYRFEDEVRILVARHGDGWETNSTGICMPIPDMNKFLRSVVVAPEAEPWFFSIVEDVTQKYGVRSPVRRSKLTLLKT